MASQEIFKSQIRLFFEKSLEESKRVRFIAPTENGKEWMDITWEEFLTKTIKTTLFLKHFGARFRKKVALYSQTRVECTWCIQAIQACRAIYVPIYSANTQQQIKYILNNTGVEVLFTELKLLPNILNILGELPLLRTIVLIENYRQTALFEMLETYAKEHNPKSADDILKKTISLNKFLKMVSPLQTSELDEFEHLIEKAKETDIASILYTSGTTGNPKGVMLSNYNLDTNSEDWIKVLGPLILDERLDLLWLPVSHIFGWGELGLGNRLGFKTWFATPKNVLELMPKAKPTIFMSVPAYWEKLYLQAKAASEHRGTQTDKLLELTGGELKFCLSGGAGLKREIKDFFYQAGMLIIEGYGLTECSPTLTMNRKNDFDFDTVGKPFPRVQLKLASDGEILAKGPNVFKGYYRDTKSTKAAFDKNGWFKTGDIGEWTEKGFLIISGRKKDIIVTSGGKNISPQLIENKFNEDPYIEHIVLYGNEKKYLTALITLNENAVLHAAESLNLSYNNWTNLVKNPNIVNLVQKSVDEVNKTLASFETIKKFHIYEGHLTVKEGFLTASFKLKRKNVNEKFREELESLYQ